MPGQASSPQFGGFLNKSYALSDLRLKPGYIITEADGMQIIISVCVRYRLVPNSPFHYTRQSFQLYGKDAVDEAMGYFLPTKPIDRERLKFVELGNEADAN